MQLIGVVIIVCSGKRYGVVLIFTNGIAEITEICRCIFGIGEELNTPANAAYACKDKRSVFNIHSGLFNFIHLGTVNFKRAAGNTGNVIVAAALAALSCNAFINNVLRCGSAAFGKVDFCTQGQVVNGINSACAVIHAVGVRCPHCSSIIIRKIVRLLELKFGFAVRHINRVIGGHFKVIPGICTVVVFIPAACYKLIGVFCLNVYCRRKQRIGQRYYFAVCQVQIVAERIGFVILNGNDILCGQKVSVIYSGACA